MKFAHKILFLLLILCFKLAHAQNVFINELMSKNQDIIDETGEQEDWIELYNATQNSINLIGWSLTDDINEPDKFIFTEDFIIPAGGFQLLWADDDEGINHLPFKLSSDGESIALFRPENGSFIEVDFVNSPSLAPNISYGRTEDGAPNWQKNRQYSPNITNSNNKLFSTTTIDFSLPEGFYSSGVILNLQSSFPNTEIRYTTDGTRPNETSLLYTNPLILDSTVLISAAAVESNGALGLAKNNFYHIDNQHDIPILHLKTEARNLWEDDKGIYPAGTNGIEGNCLTEPRNWNQDWRRSAHISFYEPDGNLAFSKAAKIEIGGSCSRRWRMKTFKVILEEGETTDYAIFPQLPHTEYRRFKLRNSGSDFTQTMFRDGAIQEMVRGEADFDLMAFRPVILYLNGAYFGVYNLRELMNADYINRHYGARETDMVRNPWRTIKEVKEGDDIRCDAMTEWVIENDLTIPENYAYFKKQVDVNQMINYWLVEMYIANIDWPGNNLAVWRDKNDMASKWRFMLYDLDLSTSYRIGQTKTNPHFNALKHALALEDFSWSNPPQVTLWFRKLTQNPDFLFELAQRQLTFGQVIFSPERVKIMTDSITNIYHPEMSKHIDFWNNSPAHWYDGEKIPSGGSMESWEDHVSRFQQFFEERLPFMIQHYSSEFGIDSTFNLHLSYDENSGGKVVLHQNKMKTPYNYKGEYFKNIPIRMEAIAEEGFIFAKWKETGIKNSVIDFVGDKDQKLTPIFIRESGFLDVAADLELKIYPTLAADILNIETAFSSFTTATVEFINPVGQIIKIQEINIDNYFEKHEFNISQLPKGLYFVKVKTKNVEKLAKFLKK